MGVVRYVVDGLEVFTFEPIPLKLPDENPPLPPDDDENPLDPLDPPEEKLLPPLEPPPLDPPPLAIICYLLKSLSMLNS